MQPVRINYKKGIGRMSKRDIIPVFFTIDDGYAPYLEVALESMIENASKDKNYKIVVISKELNEKNRQRIAALENDNFNIEFADMSELMDKIENNITDREENRLRCDYFTLTIYFRLFIADMFTEYDKGIYIDSDIIVPGDISELYAYELGNNLIGACTDHSIEEIPQLVKYLEEGIGVDRHEYINSGMLLMNLKAMREEKFSKRFLELLTKYHIDCIAPDQDYINSICHGRILYLDECWDVMPQQGKPLYTNPKIIHYNLFDKPWCYDGVQYEDYFWKYAKRSPYYNEIIQHKNDYSDEKKQSDKKSLELLLHKGETIPDTEITFKKLYDKGVKIRL